MPRHKAAHLQKIPSLKGNGGVAPSMALPFQQEQRGSENLLKNFDSESGSIPGHRFTKTAAARAQISPLNPGAESFSLRQFVGFIKVSCGIPFGLQCGKPVCNSKEVVDSASYIICLCDRAT